MSELTQGSRQNSEGSCEENQRCRDEEHSNEEHRHEAARVFLGYFVFPIMILLYSFHKFSVSIKAPLHCEKSHCLFIGVDNTREWQNTIVMREHFETNRLE